MSDRIEREVVLEAEPEDVWRAVLADGWLAEEVRLDLQPGGEATFRTGAERKDGWIEDVVDERRLIFWWAAGEEPASRVELTLTPEDDITRLRVVETRPLERLDLVGVPLPGISGPSYGPALVAA